MKSRWLELIIVSILLLIGFGVRVHDIATVPMGFSANEIIGIRVTEVIQDRTFRVFFTTENGSIESFFYMLQIPVTLLVGDGLVGYRMMPLWTSLITLALVYAVARRLFGISVGFIALITMCFGIWPVLIGRTATHVSLVGAMTLITLLAASHAFYLQQNIRPLRPKTISYTYLALAVVLSAYTDYTGLMAGVGVFLFVLYLWYTRQTVSRHTWWNTGYALTLSMIFGLPYLISFLRTASVSGLYVFWRDRPTSPLNLLESIGHTLVAFAWRGDADPAHNIPGLALLPPEGALIAAVGLIAALWRWRKPNYALLVIFFILGLLPDMWLRGGPDYEALAFVNPLVYILIGVGVVEFFRILRENSDPPEKLAWLKRQGFLGEWPQPLYRITVIFVLIIFARNIWFFRQLFADWPNRPDTQQAYHTNIGQLAVYLDHNPDGPPVLICSPQIHPTTRITEAPSDQQLLEWMLHREDIPYRVANCRQDFILLNAGATMRVVFTDAADVTTLPVQIRHWLEDAQPLSSQYLDRGTAYLLEVERRLADMGGTLQRESQIFYPRVSTEDELEHVPLPVRFGGNLALMGHEPLPLEGEHRPGDVFTLVTYWRVDGPVLPNAGVFIRLHDTPQASPYSEVNELQVDTSRLQARDIIVQVGLLRLPDTLRSQEYRLTIGVYDGETVNQLPVYDTVTGTMRGTYLLFGRPFVVTTTNGG